MANEENNTEQQPAAKKAQNEGKLKALQAAMAKIEKDFGKGSVLMFRLWRRILLPVILR